MFNVSELEARVQKIEDSLPQIDRLDQEVYSLTQKLEKATNLLIDIIEEKNRLGVHDLEYVFLKLNIDGTKYHELPLLISKTEREFRKTGKFPTIQEFHQKVIELFSLTEDDQKIFTLEVTKNVLEKFMNDEDNTFPVCKMILSSH
ncbi:hypothetical protein NSA56_18055 [Oceanobacillus caeni]|uniref:Uncharacterized protein n=1 Tax=Oceanobacillus caeni TaxID=405946 RepID=A0ABR5MME5_9BACI|nr:MULTISPECIES: hypothetical protein [Bacillaceae]KKE79463.1 hypothetical protein WH51_07265 [Bacilli bacterium VT-13-104]PZD81411.1 hypothetical protein DEJ64_17355 [Bacilli bacterium]KPH77635.1 hypothetical protein AFL42_03315 [Oceanobacillus caeni]MBU8792329.1 hypothetical protein [Oceanobacillus caeni]MCR1836237.1 hypothetical protein [Oceanobacillus caeni]